MNRLLLIDGDLLAYRHAAAAEKETDWGEGMTTLHADAGLAIENMDHDLSLTCEKLDADEFVVCLSDDNSRFREKLGFDYKAHRKTVRRPMVLPHLRAYLRADFAWAAKWKPGLEADDVMGIMSTNPKLYPTFEKVIVSVDKDMKTIPGLLYDGKELALITRDAADKWHLQQTLMGDKADGYPGCKGIGPVKAAKIVNDGWPAVLEAFIKAGHDEAFALTMARLARILRHEDWNYKTQEPILWNPPQVSFESTTR
jgi:DNA polymerase-1